MSEPDSATASDRLASEPLILDCRGLRCPLPVIELAKVAAGGGSGTEIRVLTDDEAARTDIPAWCRLRGHDYLGEADHLGGSAHLVRLR